MRPMVGIPLLALFDSWPNERRRIERLKSHVLFFWVLVVKDVFGNMLVLDVGFCFYCITNSSFAVAVSLLLLLL